MQNIIDINEFKEVAPALLWRRAALDQIDRFEEVVVDLTRRFRVTAKVVGRHRSKSIDLPVVMLSTDAGEFTLRDNFHDVNLMTILQQPATPSPEQLFADIQAPLTWDWYLSEIERARGYGWREWSDEEMNDPRVLRVLRVRDERASSVDMWWEKKPDEKDRWSRRMSSPEWYGRDWSSGEFVWDGDFGPGVRLFHQPHAHAKGIKVTTSNRKYMKGISDFIIVTDTLASAATMIERLHEAPA